MPACSAAGCKVPINPGSQQRCPLLASAKIGRRSGTWGDGVWGGVTDAHADIFDVLELCQTISAVANVQQCFEFYGETQIVF